MSKIISLDKLARYQQNLEKAIVYPDGVYDTLSALQTAFPSGTSGVFVVLETKKWYEYLNGAWTARGDYLTFYWIDAAKINGNYPTMSVGKSDVADNLKTNKGAHVTDAVAGFDPISQSVEEGSFAKVDGFKGRSFAYNQNSQIFNGNVTSWAIIGNFDNYSTTSSSMTGTCKTHNFSSLRNGVFKLTLNHTYLITTKIISDTAINVLIYQSDFNMTLYGSHTDVPVSANTKTQIKALLTPTDAREGLEYVRFILRATDGSSKPTVTVDNINIFDLTAMGITASTADEAIAALRSFGIEPTVYNDYSVGKMIDSQVDGITSRGFNQWNEQYTIANIETTGQSNPGEVVSGNKLVSSFIRCKGGETYYKHGTTSYGWLLFFYYDKNQNFISNDGSWTGDGTFTTPENAYFMRFKSYNNATTYNHDICINISNASLNGTYQPYVEDVHALSLPVMRSAGDVTDDCEKVRVGTYTFTGSEGFTQYGTSWVCQTTVPSGQPIDNNLTTDCKYRISWSNAYRTNFQLNDVEFESEAQLQSYIAGKTINYELANPTDQPAIELPENLKVWNGGTLETSYASPNTTPALISLTYQANIRVFIENLGGREEDINWDADNIVSQSQLNAGLALKADISKLEDGQIKVAIAKSLYTEVGKDDQTPFSSTTVGIDTDVETGYQELRKLVGVDVVDVQLARNPNFADTSVWEAVEGTKSVSSNILTYTISNDNSRGQVYQNVPIVNGQKYFMIAYIKSSKATTWTLRLGSDYSGAVSCAANTWTLLMRISTSTQDGSKEFNIYHRDEDLMAGDTLQIKFAYIVPLAQRYGSNEVVNAIIGNDASTQVANLIAFDPNILKLTSYDAGSFPTVKAAKLETVDYNQWDEEWEVGSIYGNTGANDDSTTNVIRSKNYIQIEYGNQYYLKMPGSTYVWMFCYDANKNFISTIAAYSNAIITGIPLNARFIRFRTIADYGTTYNNDICIFLYWDGSRIGYEPYQKHEVALPNERLHGILKVVDGKVVADGDELYPDGNSKKRFVDYTITGSESITKARCAGDNGHYFFDIQMPSNQPLAPSTGDYWSGKSIALITSNGLVSASQANTDYYGRDNSIAVLGRNLHISNNAWDNKTAEEVKALLLGFTIAYERATETETDSDAYADTFFGDDFGTMRFLDENGNEIAGLLGCEIFYKANIAGFAESLYVKTDGDPDDVVVQSELTAEATVRGATDNALQAALGGTLRQVLCVKESLDFDNTAYVDLGSLTWSYSNVNQRFSTSFNATGSGNNNTPSKLVCTKYKNYAYNSLANNGIAISSDGLALHIMDSNYTDKDAFKAAMQGVLLAYEKA